MSPAVIRRYNPHGKTFQYFIESDETWTDDIFNATRFYDADEIVRCSKILLDRGFTKHYVVDYEVTVISSVMDR